jgi:hypothetical protein
MPALKLALRLLAYAWAAPYSAVGFLVGLLALLFGARMHVHQGALEFGGGRIGALLARLPGRFRFCAITFGHVILGVDHTALAAARAHEQVHVRQYERWGPLFIPAYLLSSLAQWVCGRSPYLDNHFEREAYAKAGTAVQPNPNSRTQRTQKMRRGRRKIQKT